MATADVDGYLQGLPLDRRAVLRAVREAAQRVLVGHDERIAHGMPAWYRGDEQRFAFASQKQYVALYVDQNVVAVNAERLGGVDCGKSCLRFRKPEQIDIGLVEHLLAQTAAR